MIARHRLGDFNAMRKNSDKVVALLKSKAASQEPCDLQDLFARFTMDTAAEFLFGMDSLNTLDHPLPKPRSQSRNDTCSALDGYGSFVSAYHTANFNVTRRYSVPSAAWTAREFFRDSQETPMRVIADYLKPLARKALERKKERKDKEAVGEEVSYLDHLAAATDGTNLSDLKSV